MTPGQSLRTRDPKLFFKRLDPGRKRRDQSRLDWIWLNHNRVGLIPIRQD